MIPTSDSFTIEIRITGDEKEKIDYIDRKRKKRDGPIIGDFESMIETQFAVAMVSKGGKPKKLK